MSAQEPRTAKSALARAVIHELVVVQGLSYIDAAKRADEMAEAEAAPYREAAEVIRSWLDEIEAA